MRIAAALLAVAASVAVSACGSDSSSDEGSSTSAVAGKEAGIYRNVQLNVANGVPAHPDGPDHDWFYLCFYTPDQCTSEAGDQRWGDGYDVGRGKSVAATYDDELTGRLQYPVGYAYTEFTAFNPCCAAPWIKLAMYSDIKDAPDGSPALMDSGKWSLSEGDPPQTVKLSGDSFTLARSADTSDDVVLTLTALGGGSSP